MKDREDLAGLFTDITQEEFYEMNNLLVKPDDLEEPVEVEPKKRRISWYKVTDYAARAAILGSLGFAAGYGLLRFSEDHKKEEEPVRYYDYDPNKGDPLAQLEEFIKYPENNPPTSDVVNSYLIGNYFLGREGIGAISDFEVRTNRDEDDKKETIEKQNRVIFLGAELVAKLDPERGVEVDEEEGVIIYGGRKFDLKNPYDFFFLDEMIAQNLNIFDPERKIQEQYLARQKLDDLNWLIDSEVSLEFEWEDIGTLSSDSLVNLARIYRTFDKLGYHDVPEKIRYISYLIDQDLGYAGGIYRDVEATIEIAKSSGPYTAVHEEGHHVQARFAEFSQDKFDSAVSLAIQRVDGQYDVKDTFIDSSERVATISMEDYAVTFDKYFSDGVAFRKRIIELQKKSPAAAEVLLTKYNFMKSVFQGKEFSKDGQEVDIQPGDVISISDPDGRTSGIGLRKSPNFETSTGDHIVYDGDLLEIQNGPTEILGPDGETRRMYNVALITLDEKTGEVQQKEYGWIWEKWLGYEILTNEVRRELVD